MRSFRIGSAFGIPIELDLTFLLVLPLFAWLIASQVGQWVGILNDVLGAGLAVDPLSTGSVPLVLGAIAAVGLFAGVVLHELGHSLVAMRFGYPIDSITLWLFGGIAQLTEMPEDWRQEFAIAIAGPAVSIALGVLSYAAFWALPATAGLAELRFLLGYLALMNVALAAFNLLPGFPMDGGRVLRALLARRRPHARATQIAAEVGKGFALLLGLFGILNLNIILIGIAFFIYVGASSEAQQTMMRAAFEGVTVEDIMTPAEDVNVVTVEDSVADLLDRMFRERHTGYPVMDDGELVGLVTLEDARGIREVERDAYTVGDVMSRELRTVEVDSDVLTAMQRMQEHGIGRLLVVDGAGTFAGIFSRTDLMTALNIIQTTGSLQPGEPVTNEAPSAR